MNGFDLGGVRLAEVACSVSKACLYMSLMSLFESWDWYHCDWPGVECWGGDGGSKKREAQKISLHRDPTLEKTYDTHLH